MYLKKIILLIFIIFGLIPIIKFGQEVGAEATSGFHKGLREFGDLVQSEVGDEFRSQWLNLAEIFHQAYSQAPDSSEAVSSLFYLGRTYEELGKRSFLRSDFEKAEKYYDQIIRNYPSHPKADDAQFSKAGIYLNYYHDSAQAYIEYLRVVYNFPKGDMAPKAQEELKKLDQANLQKIRRSLSLQETPVNEDSKEIERERIKAEEAERSRKREATGGGPLFITEIHSTLPHSAGGVHARISFENVSDKRIKYVRFSATAYNGVGDKVSCEIHRSHTRMLLSTGPYLPWSHETSYWENVWYNHSIVCIEIQIVSVEFMDGQVLRSLNTQRALNEGVVNCCKVD